MQNFLEDMLSDEDKAKIYASLDPNAARPLTDTGGWTSQLNDPSVQVNQELADPIPKPMSTPKPMIAAPQVAAQPRMPAAVMPTQENAFGDEYQSKQKQLDDENGSYDTRGAIQGALASLGAAFQGKDSLGAVSQVMKQRGEQRKDKSAALDKWLSNKRQEIADKRGQVLASREDQQYSDETDPTSKASLIAQQAAKKLGYKGDTSNMTAQQFKEFSPALEKIYQVEMKKQERSDAAKKKGDDGYEKYVEGVEKQAQTLRGDDAAKLSSAKLSAIASGRALLKQYEGREDEMTPDQLAILAADRVKAVTGGVPGQEEISKMLPSNIGTGWSSLKSKFTGSPEPANSGGWVKEAARDFDAQEDAARAILKNRQDQVTSNPRLHPADKARIAQMAVPPEYQEREPDVEQYAKDHGITYQQALGVRQKRTGK